MFDIGMFEMILIGVIALLVLGPERLPEAARSAGRMVGKARKFIAGVKTDVKSQMSVAELEELRQLRQDLTMAKTELHRVQGSAGNALNEKVPDIAASDEPLAIDDKKPAKPADSKKKQKSPDQA
jgi:sec-independent protein translocase protein TatB